MHTQNFPRQAPMPVERTWTGRVRPQGRRGRRRPRVLAEDQLLPAVPAAGHGPGSGGSHRHVRHHHPRPQPRSRPSGLQGEPLVRRQVRPRRDHRPLGDQIEILSNGEYKSVLHRTTVNKEKARMSWPEFCSPPGETVVEPLPQLASDDAPAKYKTKKYKDYAYWKPNKIPQ
ncbi:unnamed protein product [Musa acuminata subsp. burmannicoides]